MRGPIIGISFTAVLVTFALSYFASFMTRGFALITENSTAGVWVMDPAVESAELTINMPDSALARVRSVDGVRDAVPLALGDADASFPNGRFQSFQVIGVDDATLAGAPRLKGGETPMALHSPDAVIVDSGGTSGKLETPLLEVDQWPSDGPYLEVPTRELRTGDVLLVNDHRIKVVGSSHTIPRHPPQPLIYTTYSNASRVLPTEPGLLTFVLATAQTGISAQELAHRIRTQTGLRARTLEAFKYENLKQYVVLKAMGASRHLLLTMISIQAGLCALLGTGIGIGLCAIIGEAVATLGYPFRMMWFTPLFGLSGGLIVSLKAAAISIRQVLKLEPGVVFSGR